MITSQQGKVIGRGYTETVKRVNDMDDYKRLKRDYDALQMRMAQLTRQYDELKYWAADIEDNFTQRVNEKVEELLSDNTTSANETATLTAEEQAIIEIDRNGEFVDSNGIKWVNIARAAELKGVAYQTIYRAALGQMKTAKIQSWVVGTLSNGNDRILVNPDSYVRGKRGKRKAS